MFGNFSHLTHKIGVFIASPSDAVKAVSQQTCGGFGYPGHDRVFKISSLKDTFSGLFFVTAMRYSRVCKACPPVRRMLVRRVTGR